MKRPKTIRPLLIFGTRPEAIKMAPVVKACRREPGIEPIVCLTGQHDEMLQQVVDWFELAIDENLELMSQDQSLSQLTGRCVQGMDELLSRYHPDCVVGQGDTTTVMSAALAAFYHRRPFVHVEAGLRTGDLNAPWPEEMNRRIAALATSLHCAPTRRAADALISEGVNPQQIRVTGNTVIDALLETLARQRADGSAWRNRYAGFDGKQTVLITAHRRENFGAGFAAICQAISILAERFPDCHFVFPVHLNPNVQRPAHAALGARDNIHLMPPATYPEFVWLMERCTLLLTDSGGVQEEGPTLKKPVLIMRDITERPEAVEAGAARLVGSSINHIVDGVGALLTDASLYAAHQVAQNPYGDGHAAERIVAWMLEQPWRW